MTTTNPGGASAQPADEPQTWAVVGAGMLGLSLAHKLVQQGHAVTIFEASDEPGGLAAPWTFDIAGTSDTSADSVSWDRHYHVTLLSDLRVNALLDQLGLADDMEWVETKAGYYAPDGRLHPMSNAIEYLKLPALNLVEKGRLGATILWGSRVKDWQKMEQIPVETWLRKWSGKGTYEKLWLPLLRAKLSDAYKDASAAFIWATIQRLYAARQAGIKKEMFGYVKGGGYKHTLDRFVHVLTQQGVHIQTSTPVENISQNTEGLRVTTAHGEQNFDRVVCTTASSLTAKMCPDLTTPEQDLLNAIQYQGVVCASVLLNKPLTDYYLTYITEPSTPFTAVVEMTSFVDPSELGGNHLIYLPKYVPSDDPLFEVSDQELRSSFMSYLQKMHPSVSEDNVLAWKVSRVRNVFAVPTLNYSTKVPAMVTSVPGLFVVNSSQIVNGTLNVEETLALRDQALEVLQ